MYCEQDSISWRTWSDLSLLQSEVFQIMNSVLLAVIRTVPSVDRTGKDVSFNSSDTFPVARSSTLVGPVFSAKTIHSPVGPNATEWINPAELSYVLISLPSGRCQSLSLKLSPSPAAARVCPSGEMATA